MFNRSRDVQLESGYTTKVLTCDRSWDVRPELRSATRVEMYDGAMMDDRRRDV
jgi:hypothetical protein